MEPEARTSETRVEYKVIGNLFATMGTRGGAALLRAIAKAGVDVNVADPSGKTLLLCAVDFAALCDDKMRVRIAEGVFFLLHHGADPNLADDRGRTPFMLALMWRQKLIAELLFLSGANFRSRVH